MAKFCKIPPSSSSGTGNATVHIIALKNTSTAPRSQTFVVTSATGIRRTITVNQEGAKKDLYLSFPSGSVSTSIGVGQVFFISVDGPDMVQAEFYHKLGTVKSVTSSQIVIDMSSLTQTDINRIYNDLNTGDMIEMDEIFFGIAVDDDPAAQWFPIVKTTETSGTAGTYNYASEYVAESITQSYDGTPITLNCTAVDGAAPSASSLVITPKSPKISIEDEVIFTVKYTKIIPDSLQFNAGPEMDNSENSVYEFDWNPPASTGGVNASGSFTFRIATNSEASEDTYTFTVTATNENGEDITARGEVIVVL